MREMRVLGAVAIVAVLAFGCAAQPPSTQVAPQNPTSAKAATAMTGGCGSTRVVKGGAPAWMRELEGTSTYTDVVPYALGSPPTAAAVVFGYPLRSGHPQNPSNKILWLVSLPPRAGSLDITAHPIGAATPSVSQSAAFLPSGDIPSTIDMPQSGCWHFDLSWSGHHSAIELQYE
jgi:hypothetical protein